LGLPPERLIGVPDEGINERAAAALRGLGLVDCDPSSLVVAHLLRIFGGGLYTYMTE